MKAQALETDELVIGGGSAGCHAALRANALGSRVQMVVKGKMGRSGGHTARELSGGGAVNSRLLLDAYLG